VSSFVAINVRRLDAGTDGEEAELVGTVVVGPRVWNRAKQTSNPSGGPTRRLRAGRWVPMPMRERWWT